MTELVSIVAPAQNEEASLPTLVEEIVEAMGRCDQAFEIVVVDDGSVDGTWACLMELARNWPCVRPLRSRKAQGQSAALLLGIGHARGEVVVTMDADLQNDPADIPRLLELLPGRSLVCGVRTDRQDILIRRLASRVGNAARRWVLGDSFVDIGCSLRAYRAETLEQLPAFNGMHRYLPIFVVARGGEWTSLSVNHRPRVAGRSKYSAAGKRLWMGIFDLVGVRWLLRRSVDTRPGHAVAEDVRQDSDLVGGELAGDGLGGADSIVDRAS